MSVDQRPQAGQAAVVVPPGRGGVVEGRSYQIQGWRTVRDLTAELRFPSEDACRTWLRRQRIANVRRGRVILVSSVDVDRALRS